MKIIFAQGNPGSEYETTRHNVGFLAADFFAKEKGSEFQAKPKFFADIAELNEAGEKARDYIMNLPARLLRVAERMKNPTMDYKFRWIAG